MHISRAYDFILLLSLLVTQLIEKNMPGPGFTGIDSRGSSLVARTAS